MGMCPEGRKYGVLIRPEDQEGLGASQKAAAQPAPPPLDQSAADPLTASATWASITGLNSVEVRE
jgi:hypothetical protein